MNFFSTEGSKKDDLWLVDGSPNFAIFPGGIIESISSDAPILLKVGNQAFGETHIRTKHAQWLAKHQRTVAEMVHFKLGQPGQIYCTENGSKFKINLGIAPSALLVLNFLSHEQIGPHFSVTTLYYHQQRLDGMPLGRYPGRR